MSTDILRDMLKGMDAKTVETFMESSIEHGCELFSVHNLALGDTEGRTEKELAFHLIQSFSDYMMLTYDKQPDSIVVSPAMYKKLSGYDYDRKKDGLVGYMGVLAGRGVYVYAKMQDSLISLFITKPILKGVVPLTFNIEENEKNI